jgi:integrase/recombinase XerC
MVALFLKYLRFEKRASPHTAKAYETDLQQFQDYLLIQYDLTSPEVTDFNMIRSWIVALVEQKIEPSSINRKIATLRAFFKFLLKMDLIKVNPMLKIKALKEAQTLPKFVETKAMERLLDDIAFKDSFEGKRDRLIIELFYGTGMRLAELLGLKIKDIDRYTGLITVLGKRSKERKIPATPAVFDALESYIKVLPDNFPESVLIQTADGKDAYPMLVQRIIKKNLMAVTSLQQKSPHVLRHSFATHLLNQGADIGAIKDLLGHSSLAATQIYTHNSIERLKKVHKKNHPKG